MIKTDELPTALRSPTVSVLKRCKKTPSYATRTTGQTCMCQKICPCNVNNEVGGGNKCMDQQQKPSPSVKEHFTVELVHRAVEWNVQ